MRVKYYDRTRKHLVYFCEQATPDYWDRHWHNADLRNKRSYRAAKYSYVVTVTRKYLNPGDGWILEGGCGLGSNVEMLQLSGYKCVGVDNAIRTVQMLRDSRPDLDIRYGDIRELDFPTCHLAGYWSIGVIEHFQNGYKDIAEEMLRVIKPGGYLFLSFPYMSCFRKIKAKLGAYRELPNHEIAGFYQFALNTENVIRIFSGTGFELVRTMRSGSLFHGLKDEIPSLTAGLDFITRYRGSNIFTKSCYFLLNKTLSAIFGFMFSHTILLVFRKPIHISS